MAPTKSRTIQRRSSKQMTRKLHLLRLASEKRKSLGSTPLLPSSSSTPQPLSTPSTSPSPLSTPSTSPPLPSSSTSQSHSSFIPPLSSTSTSSAPTPISTSKKKLQFFSNPDTAVPLFHQDIPYLPTTLVDLTTLQSLFQGLRCKECGSDSLTLHGNQSRSKGFIVFLEVWCGTCQSSINSTFTSPRLKETKCFEVSRKVVASTLASGIGHATLQKFSEFAGMPGISLKTFNYHFNSVYVKAQAYAQSMLRQTREKVTAYYKSYHPECFNPDGTLDIAVSYDGTWAKRGHTSKVGCGAVIDVLTGLVIDFHVMSSHCQFCNLHANDEAILRAHLDSDRCTKNYQGSSGGMEVAGALVIWRRSLDHGMRYLQMVGDGDSKAFTAVREAQLYGSQQVTKEECVNHVAKRLNTALRSFAKIALLQKYYTRSVRGSNQNVEEMSKAIWATFKHSTSALDNPQKEDHEDCPTGADSWCAYQKECALGRSPVKMKEPTTHLNQTVAAYVRPVYKRLTDPSLLSRCLLGKTQNSNESFHSVIWAKCPKHLFAGYKRVFVACSLAAGEFNMGSTASHDFITRLGVPCSIHRASLGRRRDLKRIRAADAAVTVVAKKRREVRRLAQQKSQEEFVRSEGGPSYASGGFE